MKKTVDNHDFHRAFKDYGRGSQFSPSALDALFEYFEEFETMTGEEITLDVIGICCDWTEYDSAVEAATDLSDLVADEDEDEDEREQSALEYLCDRCNVIGTRAKSIVVQSF